MGFPDSHDLLDFYLFRLVIDEVKDGKRPAYMEPVDDRGVWKVQLFLVPTGKRVFFKLEYLFDDNTPGFMREAF